MTEAHNDNKNTWTSIGLQADLIVNRLRNEALIRALLDGTNKETDENRGRDTNGGSGDKDAANNEAENIKEQLNRLRAIEDVLRRKGY